MTQPELQNVINELIRLGEDPDELNYWLEIYDSLPEQNQAQLALNLRQELDSLKQPQ
jgi:hypothetical protein